MCLYTYARMHKRAKKAEAHHPANPACGRGFQPAHPPPCKGCERGSRINSLGTTCGYTLESKVCQPGGCPRKAREPAKGEALLGKPRGAYMEWKQSFRVGFGTSGIFICSTTEHMREDIRGRGYIKSSITFHAYVFVLMLVHWRGKRRLDLLQALGVGG